MDFSKFNRQEQLAPANADHIKEMMAANELRYRKGQPRSIRFDAGQGILTLDGQEAITTAGESFDMILIAYRAFDGDVFKMGDKEWIELFWINNLGNVCQTMMHTYSRAELALVSRDLYYDRVELRDVVLTVTPEKRTNAQGKDYYVAQFKSTPLSKEQQESMRLVHEHLAPIYRRESFSIDHTERKAEGYGPVPLSDPEPTAAPSPMDDMPMHPGATKA